MRRTIARSTSPPRPASTSITSRQRRSESGRQPLNANSAVRVPLLRIWKTPPTPSPGDFRLRWMLAAATSSSLGARVPRAAAASAARRASRRALMAAIMSIGGSAVRGGGSGRGTGVGRATGSTTLGAGCGASGGRGATGGGTAAAGAPGAATDAGSASTSSTVIGGCAMPPSVSTGRWRRGIAKISAWATSEATTATSMRRTLITMSTASRPRAIFRAG